MADDEEDELHCFSHAKQCFPAVQDWEYMNMISTQSTKNDAFVSRSDMSPGGMKLGKYENGSS